MFTCAFCFEACSDLRSCLTPQCCDCAAYDPRQCLPECSYDHTRDHSRDHGDNLTSANPVAVALTNLAKIYLTTLESNLLKLNELNQVKQQSNQELIQLHQLLYPQLTQTLMALSKDHDLNHRDVQFKIARLQQATEFCHSFTTNSVKMAPEAVANYLVMIEQFLSKLTIPESRPLMLPLPPLTVLTAPQQIQTSLIAAIAAIAAISQSPTIREFRLEDYHISTHPFCASCTDPAFDKPELRDVYLARHHDSNRDRDRTILVDLAAGQTFSNAETPIRLAAVNQIDYFDLGRTGKWNLVELSKPTRSNPVGLSLFSLWPPVGSTQPDQPIFQVLIEFDRFGTRNNIALQDSHDHIIVTNYNNSTISCYSLADYRGTNDKVDSNLSNYHHYQPKPKWLLELPRGHRLASVQLFTDYIVLFSISDQELRWYDLATGSLQRSTKVAFDPHEHVQGSSLIDGRLHLSVGSDKIIGANAKRILTFNLLGELQSSQTWVTPELGWGQKHRFCLGGSSQLYLVVG